MQKVHCTYIADEDQSRASFETELLLACIKLECTIIGWYFESREGAIKIEINVEDLWRQIKAEFEEEATEEVLSANKRQNS